jgi:hypothetical protein
MCVNNAITNKDKFFIEKFLEKERVQSLKENPTYKDEIKFIKAVQHVVLNTVPIGRGLEYGKPREPEDIYKAVASGQTGACFDRSRLIEKILRSRGFKTRHVFMCSVDYNRRRLKPWFSRAAKTHAVSEVLTKKGWLVVDSNHDWVSLDRQAHPYSMKCIQCKKNMLWEKPMCSDMKEICKEPFTFLYGFYYRCGRLYPPFLFCLPLTAADTKIKVCIPFPDMNCCELLYNFPLIEKIRGLRNSKEHTV